MDYDSPGSVAASGAQRRPALSAWGPSSHRWVWRKYCCALRAWSVFAQARRLLVKRQADARGVARSIVSQLQTRCGRPHFTRLRRGEVQNHGGLAVLQCLP